MIYILTSSTPNGAEGYIGRYERNLFELDQLGHSYTPTMRKHTFLKNFVDPEYAMIVEILESDPNKDFDACVLDIRRKASDVDARGRFSRQVNSTMRHTGRNRHHDDTTTNDADNVADNNNDKRNANSLNNIFSLPKTVWQGMNCEQRYLWKSIQRSHHDTNKQMKQNDAQRDQNTKTHPSDHNNNNNNQPDEQNYVPQKSVPPPLLRGHVIEFPSTSELTRVIS